MPSRPPSRRWVVGLVAVLMIAGCSTSGQDHGLAREAGRVESGTATGSPAGSSSSTSTHEPTQPATMAPKGAGNPSSATVSDAIPRPPPTPIRGGQRYANGRVYCAAGGGPPVQPSPVVSVNPDGTDRRTIAQGTYVGASRDGSRIWFTRPPGQLWRMRPDGSEQQQVLRLPGEILTPAESPDTRSVAFTFTSAQTHVSEVWVAQADGSLPHKLAGASRSATTRSGQSIRGAVHPSWSPDGGSIAVASTDSGRFEVWTMASDGSAAHQL